MSLFEAAMAMCHDCSRNDAPLEWDCAGNTKICATCKEKRGEREQGARSARSLESEQMENDLQIPRHL